MWSSMTGSVERDIAVELEGEPAERVFFGDGDYALSLDRLAEVAERAGGAISAHCLMPNHVRIVAMSGNEHGLQRTFRTAHRHCTGCINADTDGRGAVERQLYQARHAPEMDPRVRGG